MIKTVKESVAERMRENGVSVPHNRQVELLYDLGNNMYQGIWVDTGVEVHIHRFMLE